MVIITRKRPETNEVFTFFQDGYLNKILMFYKKAIEKYKTSVVIVIDGRSGMGKTTLGNQIGITFDENYGLKNIYYNPDDFLKGLSVAKPGECLMFDEAMIISNRSSLSAINRMVVQAMSMIRSKRLYIIFCVNSIFDLDRNLAMSRADLLLHLYGNSLIDRGKYGAFFKATDNREKIKELFLLGKKLYDYSRPKANFVSHFPKEFVVEEKEYEIQKQKGVNNFLTLKAGSRTQKAYKTRNTLIRNLRKDGLTPQQISEKTDLTIQQVYEIINIKGNLDETG